MDSEFVRKKAVMMRERLPYIMSAVAQVIASNADFPVKPISIRVRMRELTSAVENRCGQLLPHEHSDIVDLLVREPGWLSVEDKNDYEDEDENNRRPSTPLGMVGVVILAEMMKELEPDIKEAIQSQYGDITFASVIEEIQGALEAAWEVDPVLSDILDKSCTRQQESKVIPASRNLMPPMAKVRVALTHAGNKTGDNSKLVAARTLMELMDLINVMGYELDKTHVPQQATQGPSPR